MATVKREPLTFVRFTKERWFHLCLMAAAMSVHFAGSADQSRVGEESGVTGEPREETAYELLISDWSSDVYSSDLKPVPAGLTGAGSDRRGGRGEDDGALSGGLILR